MATARDRIEILDRKTQHPSWMIVCDLEPGAIEPDGTPKYSHHWTGWWWEPREGDEFHIYTDRTQAESYLKDELNRMLRKLPGSWSAKLWNWFSKRSSRRAID